MSEPRTEAGQMFRAFLKAHKAGDWPEQICAIEAEAARSEPAPMTLAEFDARINVLAATPAADTGALDVERLARALEQCWRIKWETEPQKGTVVIFGAYAEAIAREYAALAEADR